jgi:hypothetical protein
MAQAAALRAGDLLGRYRAAHGHDAVTHVASPQRAELALAQSGVGSHAHELGVLDVLGALGVIPCAVRSVRAIGQRFSQRLDLAHRVGLERVALLFAPAVSAPRGSC